MSTHDIIAVRPTDDAEPISDIVDFLQMSPEVLVGKIIQEVELYEEITAHLDLMVRRTAENIAEMKQTRDKIVKNIGLMIKALERLAPEHVGDLKAHIDIIVAEVEAREMRNQLAS